MAKSTNRFGRQLARLRKARGWSIYEACNQTETIKRESLIRLESGRTDPKKILVRTMIELVDLYWPDVDISDIFYDDTKLNHYYLARRGPVHG